MLTMRSIQYLTIDINKRTQQPVTANEGEIGSRFLKIKIMDGNRPFDLTGATVYLYALKTDNTKIFNVVEIEEETQGIVLAELTSQLLVESGNVKLSLIITEGANKLASKEFILDVDDSIFDDDAIESTNEFTALTTALGQVQDIDNRFNEVASQFNTIKTQFSYCGGQKFEIEKHLNIFNNTFTNTPNTIYWCWVIRVDDKIENPKGKYYMYYSTDHEGINGAIYLAYSNDLLSGWTSIGQIYKNGGYETETPSVMWDEKNKKFIMYFHSYGTTLGEAQTSHYITSENGINFDDSTKTKLLNLDMTKLSGDGHNGYFHPFKIGNKYIAYHLLGGGNTPRFGLSYSDDGYNWITDYKQIGYLCLKDNRYMSVNHCTIINKYGLDWLIGANTNFTSGATAKNAYVGIVPMQDLYTPIGYDEKLFELNEIGESANIRQVSLYQEDNKIYVFYQCDNNLHCAIIK